MIAVPKPGGRQFCIDETEVTNENYAAFLTLSPDTSGQISACSWNDSYVPASSTGCQYDAANSPKIPISCVDWCDARSYCEWAGKRLCGAFDGGPSTPARFADATHSQWYAACSMGGTRAFPYGDVYIRDACVGLDHDGTAAENVGTHPGCRGGYLGLHDMSGNVAEWEDSCVASAGASDSCLVRGGDRFSKDVIYGPPPVPTLLCNSSDPGDTTPSPATSRRDFRGPFVGFRCCYDP
jgi:formylglycine-generating enzyme required for sulfatase activity